MDETLVLRTGDVARAAGGNTQTLRYYERRRLLRAPERALNGYRHYDVDSVRVVRFIKRAQALGFSLREVHELLRLRESDGVPCAKVRARAEEKIAEIVAKQRQLAAMCKALGSLVATCRTESSRRVCPLLDALANDEESTFEKAGGRGARGRQGRQRVPAMQRSCRPKLNSHEAQPSGEKRK
jgi:MerR family mercuric resistance operon transcriptional regulator/MerR family gold-responsive transcriptional activator of gol and ges genes